MQITDRYKVKNECKIYYDGFTMARIALIRGQIWRVHTIPSEDYAYYTIYRDNVCLGITEEDFKKIFVEVEEKNNGR